MRNYAALLFSTSCSATSLASPNDAIELAQRNPADYQVVSDCVGLFCNLDLNKNGIADYKEYRSENCECLEDNGLDV